MIATTQPEKIDPATVLGECWCCGKRFTQAQLECANKLHAHHHARGQYQYGYTKRAPFVPLTASEFLAGKLIHSGDGITIDGKPIEYCTDCHTKIARSARGYRWPTRTTSCDRFYKRWKEGKIDLPITWRIEHGTDLGTDKAKPGEVAGNCEVPIVGRFGLPERRQFGSNAEPCWRAVPR